MRFSSLEKDRRKFLTHKSDMVLRQAMSSSRAAEQHVPMISSAKPAQSRMLSNPAAHCWCWEDMRECHKVIAWLSWPDFRTLRYTRGVEFRCLKERMSIPPA